MLASTLRDLVARENLARNREALTPIERRPSSSARRRLRSDVDPAVPRLHVPLDGTSRTYVSR